MLCCGYVTSSPWSREHVKNNFRSITCIKTFFGRKTWKDGSFCNLILTPKDCESASIFEIYAQILRNPTTSEGCKNFSRGLEYTLWVSRRSAWIRAFERIYFHDHPTHRSKIFAKNWFLWKRKTPELPFWISFF